MKDSNEFKSNNNSKRRRARRKGVKVKVGNVTVTIYFDADAGPDRKPYRVVWKGADGTVCREMFGTLDDARTFAEKTASDLNNGQRPFTKEEIDKLSTLDGRVRQWGEQLAPLGRTVDQVIADALAAAQILPGWTSSQMAQEIRKRHATIKEYLSVKEVKERYLKYMKSGFKRTYSGHYLSQQSKYCNEFAREHAGRIDLVSSESVLLFVDHYRVQPTYKHKGKTPGDDGKFTADRKTKDSVYNCIRRLFAHARDVLAALPADERTAAERVERPQVAPNTPGVYTPREIFAMFGTFPDLEMMLFGAVQAFAGLRPCEAITLSDGDFQRDEHGTYTTILVRHGKRGPRGDGAPRIRQAPITPPLLALLEQLTLPKGRIFRRYRLERYVTEHIRLAGVAYKHDGLRHTFVSYRLLQLKDRNRVALEAGHTVAIQQNHYEGLVNPADVKPFWSFIPSVKSLPWQAKIPDVKTLMRQVAAKKAEGQA